MKRILTFIAASIAVILCGCESPLSDTEITNPGLLAPVITVERTQSKDGSIEHDYTCYLYDKSIQLVQLKSGSVSVNGIPMPHKKGLLGSYYSTTSASLPYALSTKYTFTITLADQKGYTASVTTQDALLNNFTAPSEVARTNAMQISWSGNDPKAELSIEIYSHYRTDSSTGSQLKTFALPVNGGNTYQIPPSQYLADMGTTSTVELVLNSEIEGTIDSRFKNGRKIKSVQRIGRSVSIR